MEDLLDEMKQTSELFFNQAEAFIKREKDLLEEIKELNLESAGIDR